VPDAERRRRMLSDPMIEVTCDGPGCDDKITIGLTATARGGYDERNVKEEIEAAGWIVDGDCHYCTEECKEVDEVDKS